MKVYEEKNELIVVLDGRIDYSNTAELEAAILGAVELHPGRPLCLDADKLTYISSAGLRVLMKLRKKMPNGIAIRNVSTEVYEIFDTTGMNLIIPIRKSIREVCLDGCKVIGTGSVGTVYRLDEETVVKIYNGGEEMIPSIEEDQKRARQAFVSGIPTAIPFGIVREGGKFGAVYEMIDANNLNDIVQKEPAALQWIIPEFVRFIRLLHSKEAYDGQLPSARDICLRTLDASTPFLSEEVFVKLRELLGRMPEDRHLLHGDVQMKNIMLSGDEMMMIDMDHLCIGNPVFEFASLYATYIAFNEVDPLDTQRFYGIDKNLSAMIFRETLREYLHDPDEERLKEAELKSRITGYLRFLTILLIERRGDQGERKERFIRHAAEQLDELVFKAEELTL